MPPSETQKISPSFRVRDTKTAKTSEVGGVRAKVYSTDDAVAVEFYHRDLESRIWLTPTQANELIQLLQAVFVEENSDATV